MSSTSLTSLIAFLFILSLGCGSDSDDTPSTEDMNNAPASGGGVSQNGPTDGPSNTPAIPGQILSCDITGEVDINGSPVEMKFCIVIRCIPTPTNPCDPSMKPSCEQLNRMEEGVTISAQTVRDDFCNGEVVEKVEGDDGLNIECHADRGSFGAMACRQAAEALATSGD